MIAVHPQNPHGITILELDRTHSLSFWGGPMIPQVPGTSPAPSLGPSKTTKNQWVSYTFASVPPISPRPKCDPHFGLPRPSPGPLQKCIPYYVFNQFRPWVPLGVILVFSDFHLGTPRPSLELPWCTGAPLKLSLGPELVICSTVTRF